MERLKNLFNDASDKVKAGGKATVARLKREPVLVAYAVALVLSVGALVGLDVSHETVMLIDTVLGLAAALYARQRVTPVSSLKNLPPEEIAALLVAELEE